MAIEKKLVISNQNRPGPMDDGPVAPDHVQPFMLEKSKLRGRIVRLPSVIEDIIAAHAYPAAIARVLAEALCLTTLLAGMLKFDGIFTLQAKGNNILRTLVCDVTTDGVLRGYAGFDADALAQANDADFATLTGGGYLAFTVDQAPGDDKAADRYQGIVPLEGNSLSDCVQTYFQQSEQITTSIRTEVAMMPNGRWSGGAIMLQQLARLGGTSDDEPVHEDVTLEAIAEDWRRAQILLQTVTQQELCQSNIPLNTVLYRLFHEEGVRIFAPLAIQKGCRCNREKIEGVLAALSPDERAEYSDNGIIRVTCEFCATHYDFPQTETTGEQT